MHYFSDLFDKVLYMFRTISLSIVRSLGTPDDGQRTCPKYVQAWKALFAT